MARKKQNKSEKIRKFLDLGMSRNWIVNRLKASPQLVYIVAKNHSLLGDKPAPNKRNKVVPMSDKEFIAKMTALVDQYRTSFKSESVSKR